LGQSTRTTSALAHHAASAELCADAAIAPRADVPAPTLRPEPASIRLALLSASHLYSALAFLRPHGTLLHGESSLTPVLRGTTIVGHSLWWSTA